LKNIFEDDTSIKATNLEGRKKHNGERESEMGKKEGKAKEQELGLVTACHCEGVAGCRVGTLSPPLRSVLFSCNWAMGPARVGDKLLRVCSSNT